MRTRPSTPAAMAPAGHQPPGMTINAVTTAAITPAITRTGRINAFQCGCMCSTTCSSLVSTLSGKPTPTSLRSVYPSDAPNVMFRPEASWSAPVTYSTIQLDSPQVNDVSGGDGHAPGAAGLRVDHQPALGVDLLGPAAQQPVTGQAYLDLPAECSTVEGVGGSQAAGIGVPGVSAPPVVPLLDGAQDGAQPRRAVAASRAGRPVPPGAAARSPRFQRGAGTARPGRGGRGRWSAAPRRPRALRRRRHGRRPRRPRWSSPSPRRRAGRSRARQGRPMPAAAAPPAVAGVADRSTG